jgi:predicted ATP-grasp superfamily ATP-dependent carboligase
MLYSISVAPDDCPVLLTMAAYHGTLAAARCLGASGIPVTVADNGFFALAHWSRFATRRHICPRLEEPERYVSWLLEFGRRFPGHVLYPTGDDVAWLFSRYRSDLGAHFRLYQPPLDVIYTLLNKKRLHEACSAVGLETPATWFVEEGDDLDRLAADLPFPVVVKPQTQVLRWPHNKGSVVHSRERLREGYEEVIRSATYSPLLVGHDPRVGRPLLQEYHPHATGDVYNLCGFVDETGGLFVVRGSRKVLQRPRRLGVGLCFETAETDGPLADKLRALCRRVGYYGAFEVEFIRQGPRLLLLDFNPRFYGQMAFEIARGLPLPLLVYEAARQRWDRLRELVERARADPPGSVAFCNRIDFSLLLRLQRLTSSMEAREEAEWRAWLASRNGTVTDAVIDPSDRGPQLAHLVQEVRRFVRHPRSFLLQLGFLV